MSPGFHATMAEGWEHQFSRETTRLDEPINPAASRYFPTA